MAIGKTAGRAKSRSGKHGAVVPNSIIQHTKSFTAPKGRMEMGGLLFGHVDSSGRNVCVVGFFPKQTESTPAYCEFEGKWMAIGAAAAHKANQVNADQEGTPTIRVIGWIHTHPDIRIFLSSTDVTTFSQMIDFSPDGRFIAVVVDPLGDKSGVFESPQQPNNYSKPEGSLDLDKNLEDRYMAFLSEMERVRHELGRDELPFIITGDLHNKHVSRGNPDDFLESNITGMHLLKKRVDELEEGVSKMTPGIHQELLKKMKEIEQKLAKKSSILEDEIEAAHLDVLKKVKEIEHENSKRSSVLEGEIEAFGIAKEILEESLSDLREEMEEKVLQTLNKSTRNSKALDSDRRSGMSRELRIDYLERELSKNKELSSNILKGLADYDVVERVDINSKAIRSLKQLVIENQSQLKTSCEKSCHESPVRREYDEWHAFWRNLNAEGATMRGTLDEHIGLIGTNQDLAMKLIKAVRGSHSIHVKGRVTPISTKVVRSVDRSAVKAAVYLRKKAKEAHDAISELSTKVVRAVDRSAVKAAVYLREKAKEANDTIPELSMKAVRAVEMSALKAAIYLRDKAKEADERIRSKHNGSD